MPITEKAGTLLPQNCPELGRFIQAQAHLRAAARILDEFSIHPVPHLDREQQESFRNMADESRSILWEVNGDVQDLLTVF